MTNRPATPEDFSRWTTLAAGATDAVIEYTIRDCWTAERGAESIGDDVGAGRYADERMTYEQERSSRRVRAGTAKFLGGAL